MSEADGYVIISTELDTTGVDEGIEEIKSEYDNETLNLNLDKNNKFLKSISNISKKIGKSFLNISASSFKFLGNIIKVVGKLGLIGGILGIVALVGLGISKAFDEAIQKDEELASKLEYLKFAMKSAFENIGSALVNVFKWLIDRLMDIMAILGGIIKLITGFNIFSKATADNFKNANKSATSLRKTLAGFDKINILEKSGQSGLLGITKNDIDGIKNLSIEVEEMSGKIKNWFLGEGYDTLWDSIKGNFKEVPKNLLKTLSPIYDYVIKPSLVEPFQNAIKTLEPVWQPIKAKFEETISEIESRWNVFVDFIRPGVIDPIEGEFTNLKDDLTSTFAPFFNLIIRWINKTFGIFGIHIDEIQTKSDELANGMEESIGGALENIESEAQNLSGQQYQININNSPLEKAKSWLDDIWDTLRGITKTNWKVAISGGLTGAVGSVSVPKMATGGIVNLPGRGVNIGGAIAGERTAEWVQPLSDEQALQKVGNAIGKNTHITVYVTNEMDGRIIGRTLEEINNENKFAKNGG